MLQATSNAQIVGRVDDRFHAQRAAVLQVLLDTGMLVERVQADTVTDIDDARVEHVLGATMFAVDDSAPEYDFATPSIAKSHIRALHYAKGSDLIVRLTRAHDIELDGDSFGTAKALKTWIERGALIVRLATKD